MASAVSSAAQQLGKLLTEEATSLYNVRGKIENLQKELIYMDGFLQDADTQQYKQKRVQLWVSDIQDLAYDAEDLIVRYLHEVPHHRRDGVRNTIKWFSRILCLCDAWNLHNLSSDIDGLRERISELKSRLQTYDIKISEPTENSEYNAKIMEDRRTYSHTHEDVVGIDEDIKKVADVLVKEDYRVVVLSGEGGLGKTTLARKVFKHKDVKVHFGDNCAWVYLSKEFKKENIFKLVLLELEKSEEERKRIKEQLQPEQLPGELHKVLEAKRCLVVIDDIWNEEAWKSIKSGFESVCATTSASKILLTTRDKGLFKHVDPSGYDRPLNRLSDDDSWKLLQRKAYIGQRSTTCTDVDRATRENEMERLGKKMLKHCHGIPIAIVALGGILSHKATISEWEEVGNNISSYLMGGILKVIELSFHDLPFYLKPCFLYLGNFPEDYKISTMRLYNLWEAEGFLVIEDEAAKRRGSSYEIGERYLTELIQRCMVQVGKCESDGRVKEFQLHDVMRDMCLRKCEETSFLNHIKAERDSTESADIKKWRRCAVNDGNPDAIDKQFEHGERAVGVRSLLVFQSMQNLSMVWKCFPLLRVLDLEGVRFIDSMDMDGVGLLIHLRYLGLKKTDIQKLPSCVYDLKCLDSLRLRINTIMEEDMLLALEKLPRLKILYLRKFVGNKLSLPPGSFPHLTTLKLFTSGELEELNFGDGALPNLQTLLLCGIGVDKWNFRAGIFPQLTNLIIFNAKELEELSFEDGALLNLQRFVLGYYGEKLEKLTNIPNTITELNVGINGGEGGDLFSLGFGDLPRLQRLNISGPNWRVSEGEKKLMFPAGSFPHLTHLSIFNNEEMEELGIGALPNLQRLDFFKCPKLKKLPEGLPPSIHISCDDPCIPGSENYNNYRYVKPLPLFQWSTNTN